MAALEWRERFNKWDDPENEIVIQPDQLQEQIIPGTGKSKSLPFPRNQKVVDSNGGGYFGPI